MLAIRRQVIALATEGEDRALPLARSQIAQHLSRTCVDQHNVRRAAVTPRRPVAVQQLIRHMHLELAAVDTFGVLGVAGLIDAALGEQAGGHGEVATIRALHRIADPRAKARQLARFAAVDGHRPHLRAARARAGEQDVAAIGRELRTAVIFT